MSSRSNVLIAAVAGLAVGIGIGLLIAPEKGSKTRKKIRDKVRDLAEKMEEGLPSGIEEIRDTFFRKGKESPQDEPQPGPANPQ
jgi:gas vesicle protein